MTKPIAQRLNGGARLHLQHGPMDLIIGAEGDRERERAFDAAKRRFSTVLSELVDELSVLRMSVSESDEPFIGETARMMDEAVRPYSSMFVTRMAAVAGAVADTVLAAMTREADLSRAYVNNGGDIALHLAPGRRYSTAIMSHNGCKLGVVDIDSDSPVRGIATSGRHGRSLSMGIADSVTVLATSAAGADIAATLIANAVDLPDHPAVERKPADDVFDDSDLGVLPVVTGCGELSSTDIQCALKAGCTRANSLISRGLIESASLHLFGETVLTDTFNQIVEPRILSYA